MKAIKTIISLVSLVYLIRTSYAGDLDTTRMIYEKGSKNYDISLLNQAYDLLQQIPEGKEYDHLFLQGLCLQRIHFIYFVKDNKEKSEVFGKQAVNTFCETLKYNSDSIVIAHRGMVYQILSGFSWLNGAKYGPKAQNDLKTIKKLNPKHFLSLFMDAIAYLDTPGFFGGDTKKALKSFVELNKDFPDNEDVKIYLARAYYKEKKYQEGLKIVKDILNTNPNNLFAQKVKNEIEKK